MEAKANRGPVHEEFEPLCRWQRHQDHDVLEIHLPEFKKDQLKVQISNSGVLKVSGERPLDSSRKSKFYTEFKLLNKYDAPAIHAKYVKGWLYITMPRRKHFASEKDEKEQVGASKVDKTPRLESKAPIPNDNNTQAQKTDPNASTMKPAVSGRRLVKVAVTLAATSAMVAILVAYVVYMYKSTLPEVDYVN